MDSAQNVRKRLLFDEAMPKATRGAAPGAVLPQCSTQHITRELRHQATEQNEDENAGVTAAVQAEQLGGLTAQRRAAAPAAAGAHQ